MPIFLRFKDFFPYFPDDLIGYEESLQKNFVLYKHKKTTNCVFLLKQTNFTLHFFLKSTLVKYTIFRNDSGMVFALYIMQTAGSLKELSGMTDGQSYFTK